MSIQETFVWNLLLRSWIHDWNIHFVLKHFLLENSFGSSVTLISLLVCQVMEVKLYHWHSHFSSFITSSPLTASQLKIKIITKLKLKKSSTYNIDQFLCLKILIRVVCVYNCITVCLSEWTRCWRRVSVTLKTLSRTVRWCFLSSAWTEDSWFRAIFTTCASDEILNRSNIRFRSSFNGNKIRISDLR